MARSQAVRRLRGEQLSGSLKVDLDGGKLRIRTKPLFQRELRKILREIKQEAREDIRRRHYRSGNLLRSIHTGKDSLRNLAGGMRVHGTVTAGSRLAPYARFVHEGTGPHIIRARKPDGYLSFILSRGSFRGITGQRVFTKQVHHPGYRGDRFLNRAAAKVVAKYGGTVDLPRRG